MKKNQILWKNLIIFISVFVVIGIIFNFYKPQENTKITVNDFIQEINTSEIKEINIQENKVNIIKTDNSNQFFYKETNETFSDLLKNYSNKIFK